MQSDATLIIQTTLATVMQAQQRLAEHLWWGGASANSTMAPSLLEQELTLLVQVANGEIERETAGVARYFEIKGVLDDVCRLLWQAPLSAEPVIPAEFWTQPGIGAVCGAVLAWLDADDLITITEAAQLLYPDAALVGSNVATQRVIRLIRSGKLHEYTANAELAPNPRHRRRVKRSEVLPLCNIVYAEDDV
ncbi:helix-turn-helix domain-containing protein [Herpetosiphon giganteus]|uniref:helix-turn-helix domain-containing protein n=1 Tax=Herpetosiphon giganteus TaxID=2029754 RepID=UPI0019582853|nr:helix-turn-helix domain-containing protein [Herpetosiphon giganteus]MBM7844952.1 hypothetical protein [Herpetosiphon giganteus]